MNSNFTNKDIGDYLSTEKIATSALTTCIAETDFLEPWINEGDKEPSWDGAIYAYSDKNHAKKNLIGRAAIQVKGKQVKNLKKRSIQYQVSMVDLENFRNDGGTLFFVVAFNSKYEKKIYYSSLLPFKINQLIKLHHGKKFPSLTFIELPDKKNDIENAVINYINDYKKQSIIKNGKNWTIPEVERLVGFDNIRLNFSFTCIGYDRNDPLPYLKKHEFYIYAGSADNSLQFPVEHISNIEIIAREQDCKISVQNTVFYTNQKTEHHRDGITIIHIGKSITIKTDLKDNGTFNFSLKGNLDGRILSIEFMIAVYKNAGFSFNEFKLDFALIQKTMNIDQYENCLHYLKLIKKMLDKFGVKKSLDIDNLTKEDENIIQLLISTQLYGKRALFKENTISDVAFFNISNVNLLLTFTRMDDGSYLVEEFFQRELPIPSDTQNNHVTSQYSSLSTNDYLKADNFNCVIVENSFKKYHNSTHYAKTNYSILYMLSAYDQDTTRTDLLALAEKLSEWLIFEQPTDTIYQINLMQCHKRRGNLSDQEIIKLTEISQDSHSSNVLLTGVYILLDNIRLAKIYLGKLSETERLEFKKYPIYQLLTKIQSNNNFY